MMTTKTTTKTKTETVTKTPTGFITEIKCNKTEETDTEIVTTAKVETKEVVRKTMEPVNAG